MKEVIILALHKSIVGGDSLALPKVQKYVCKNL